MQYRIKMSLRALILLASVVFLASCSSTPGPGKKPDYCPPYEGTNFARRSIYHEVAPGETLWRISKMYNVDVESIKRANNIRNVNDIDIGTKLYVPNASTRKHVISLYPSSKWKYIVIHHSATDFGSSAAFNKAHLKKGWKGVGYHFIIDNGTCGKDDGQIETTHRWINQMNGAHCKAGGRNYDGIGICLVGNFSDNPVSRKQMRSLVFLVNKLQDYYDIPDSRILGHGQVQGANTECPGKNFPWKRFRSAMNASD
ncbi:MAG: LysM peptidoglycan-binding domain-containing protein [Candidatus Omnitrophica bacterium]|nr:LysM peptidoglycan-binding domain-containing protein [Candidatus Omnitrophota bacterium]